MLLYEVKKKWYKEKFTSKLFPEPDDVNFNSISISFCKLQLFKIHLSFFQYLLYKLICYGTAQM